MTANELIGSLRTFEMGTRNNRSDKKKTLAFKASHSNQSEEECQIHKLVKMMNNNTEKLDEILKQGKRTPDIGNLIHERRS